MEHIFYIYFLLLIFCSEIYAEQDLLVSLEDGLVEGTYKTSYDGRKFASFEGIPYAAPPIQKFRFKDPEPAEKWNGTLKATNTYTCLQLFQIGTEKSGVAGNEDCLYLNVYLPREKINSEEKLDVIVHIHGGAFMVGSGHSFAGPEKIMDRDVVLVNFNYRLGAFGFLATEDDVFPGNYGLKDQVMALQWVQKNIAKFGGNPDSVTITGLSAGGASVHLHYFTLNANEVLFHRGWAQSGSAFNPWAVRRTPWPAAKKLITHLGCFNESIKVTLRCMRQRPALQIVEGLRSVYEAPMLPLAPFAPVLELLSQNNQNPFLIAHPYVQLKSGHVRNVPLIISQTTEEGLFPAALYYNKLDYLNENWEKLAPFILEYYDADGEVKDKASQKIKDFYFKNESLSHENFKSFAKACTQRLFHMGAEKSAKMQANASTENVYFMLFGYEGDGSGLKQIYNLSDSVHGVPHGFDATYLYKMSLMPAARLNEEEEKLKNLYLDLLISFAKTGVPTVKNVTWEPVGKEGNLKYLLIKSPDDVQMKSTKRLGAFEFWRSLELKEEESAYLFEGSTIEIV